MSVWGAYITNAHACEFLNLKSSTCDVMQWKLDITKFFVVDVTLVSCYYFLTSKKKKKPREFIQEKTFINRKDKINCHIDHNM